MTYHIQKRKPASQNSNWFTIIPFLLYERKVAILDSVCPGNCIPSVHILWKMASSVQGTELGNVGSFYTYDIHKSARCILNSGSVSFSSWSSWGRYGLMYSLNIQFIEPLALLSKFSVTCIGAVIYMSSQYSSSSTVRRLTEILLECGHSAHICYSLMDKYDKPST